MLLVKHIRNAIRRIENTASAVLKGFLETTGGHWLIQVNLVNDCDDMLVAVEDTR